MKPPLSANTWPLCLYGLLKLHLAKWAPALVLKQWVTLNCLTTAKAFTCFNTRCCSCFQRLLYIQNLFKDKATISDYWKQSKWQGNTPFFAGALQNCCCFWVLWLFLVSTLLLCYCCIRNLSCAYNPSWAAGWGSSTAILLPASCSNSVTNHTAQMWPGCSAASSSTPVRQESDGKAAQFPSWVPQETQISLLNCMETFWLWWHLPNRWNQNSEHTTLFLLYTQTINSPSRSSAWWCHIYSTDRQLVKGHQRNLAEQSSRLGSPESQVNALCRSPFSSCRLGTDQKLSMQLNNTRQCRGPAGPKCCIVVHNVERLMQ